MYALITGASSGLGSDFARHLSKMGYDVILVARRKSKLEELKKELGKDTTIVYECDLSISSNCYKMFNDLKDYDINIFINNAGLGHFGEFNTINLDKNLNLINVNVIATTILMSLYIDYFKNKNSGYILNVASAASFSTGPLLGTYYASKSYLYKLSISTYEELRKNKSKVSISVLCPGPVETEFNSVAEVKFSLKGQKSSYVTKYAIKKMLKKKLIIIPSKLIKIGKFFSRFLSEKAMAKFGYMVQKKKED